MRQYRTTVVTFVLGASLFAGEALPSNAASTRSAVSPVDTRDYTLTVASDYGNPSPAKGANVLAWRAAVAPSVESSVSVGGIDYTFTGWSGTGS